MTYGDIAEAAKTSLPARTVVALDKLCSWGEEDAKFTWVCGKLVATDPARRHGHIRSGRSGTSTTPTAWSCGGSGIGLVSWGVILKSTTRMVG